MQHKDIISLMSNLSVACMVMGANLETLQGDLALAIADALASSEATMQALQTLMMVSDGTLDK